MSRQQRKTDDKHATARRLQFLTDGVIHVDFDEKTRYEGDEGSAGHLFGGFVGPDCGEDVVRIDDRHGDVELQLIKELMRISKFYLNLAAETAAKCGKQLPADDEPALVPIGGRQVTNESHGYPAGMDVMNWLAKRNLGLSFEHGHHHSRVRLDALETAMFVRNCEPIRMQLIKELHRVADYFEHVAWILSEASDYSEKEIESLDRDLKTIEWMQQPPAELVKQARKVKVVS